MGREVWQAKVHGVPKGQIQPSSGKVGTGWWVPEAPEGLRVNTPQDSGPDVAQWHCPGSEMEALRLLDPLGKMLESRAWVGVAVRVPGKKVPSSGARSWTLSSSQALRTPLVYDDRLNSLRNK